MTEPPGQPPQLQREVQPSPVELGSVQVSPVQVSPVQASPVQASPVQHHWLAGEYHEGLEAYATLVSPTSDDARWQALCLIDLGQTFEAEQILARHARLGHPGSQIGLLHLHLLQGEESLAHEARGKLVGQTLTELDQVLLTREEGLLAHQTGNLKAATEHLKRAWLLAQPWPTGCPFLCSLASHLAGVYAVRGLEAQATPYMQYALAYAVGRRQAYFRGLHALHLAYQGQHQAAQEQMALALGAASEYPRALSVLTYEQGMLARLRGDIWAALEAFRQAAQQAQEMQETETHRYALLGEVAVLWEQQSSAAHQPLVRLEQEASNEVFQAHLTLRRESLQAFPDPEQLRQCAEYFQGRQFMREAGWAWLHTADACLRRDDQAGVQEALGQVMAVRYAIGHSESLRVELRGLYRLRQYLAGPDISPEQRELLPVVAGPVNTKAVNTEPVNTEPVVIDPVSLTQPLTLYLLGRPRLLYGNHELQLPLKRALEVLFYLLEHPASSLKSVQVALFPDTPPAQAKSYFHQVRDVLAQQTPAISIPYDPQSRTYSVNMVTGAVAVDVWRLREALKTLESLTLGRGSEEQRQLWQAWAALLDEFPTLESSAEFQEWLTTSLEVLKNEVLRLGLAVCEAAYQSAQEVAQGEALALVKRLHFYDPFHTGLSDLWLDLTRRLLGERVATQLQQELERLGE